VNVAPDWIIADTHFWHTKLWTQLNPGSRPSQSTNRIIWNWRHMVCPNDTVLHLGDVYLGVPHYEFASRFPHLPGRIYLIPGNHDHKSKRKQLAARGWQIIEPFSVEYGGKRVMFSHKPEPHVPDGALNLHGHIHDRDSPSPRHINCCPEKVGYVPITLAELLNGR